MTDVEAVVEVLRDRNLTFEELCEVNAVIGALFAEKLGEDYDPNSRLGE